MNTYLEQAALNLDKRGEEIHKAVKWFMGLGTTAFGLAFLFEGDEPAFVIRHCSVVCTLGFLGLAYAFASVSMLMVVPKDAGAGMPLQASSEMEVERLQAKSVNRGNWLLKSSALFLVLGAGAYPFIYGKPCPVICPTPQLTISATSQITPRDSVQAAQLHAIEVGVHVQA